MSDDDPQNLHLLAKLAGALIIVLIVAGVVWHGVTIGTFERIYDFSGSRNRHRHHLSATLLDGRAGNGWARLLRCGRDRSGGGFPNAGYEPHPSCNDCSLTARSRPKRAAKTSRKIVAGQQ